MRDATPRESDPGASIKTLTALRQAEAACTRCPLYRFATQAVPGEGAARARLMLVGEQPGDQEDLSGRPFVGPAGRVLDQALEQAGIARAGVFITNAVKHFKHEMRGKRCLHKRPGVYEIERWRRWLEREQAIVRPATIVALGATAARSVLGKAVSVLKGGGALCSSRTARWRSSPSTLRFSCASRIRPTRSGNSRILCTTCGSRTRCRLRRGPLSAHAGRTAARRIHVSVVAHNI